MKLSVEVMDEEEEPYLATIVIEGITSTIDEDTLEMFFGSKKKSGGGDIVEGSVMIDGDKGYLTFCDPQGNVSKHQNCSIASYYTYCFISIVPSPRSMGTYMHGEDVAVWINSLNS